jgi:hypothetical protein
MQVQVVKNHKTSVATKKGLTKIDSPKMDESRKFEN